MRGLAPNSQHGSAVLPRYSQRGSAVLPRYTVVASVVACSAAVFALASCTPEIGDKCVISTDCSIRGERLCDTSQPGGYCTQLNCRANACPEDEGTCVLFNGSLPGCGFDDRSGPSGSRVGRSFCVAQCTSDADCRSGYSCVDPRTPPWNAIILDDDQGRRACLARPEADAGAAVASHEPLPVCGPVAPDVEPIDASPARIHGGSDASPGDGSVDASVDASPIVDAGDGG